MELPINPAKPTVMHIDLNSCFATIEQQANPLLRGKPLVVAAYATPRACVLAPSIEAKRYGIKTGMRVSEAQQLYPRVKVITPDPAKYRYVYKRFCKLFRQYTPLMYPKSIDEAVLFLENTHALQNHSMEAIGQEIKLRMQQEIGDWLKCNIGIATNSFLAKLAAGLHKPDGLDIITHDNIRQTFATIDVEDFCGIAKRNRIRLASQGLFTPLQCLDAPLQTLTAAFKSVNGYYWYLRLRGWEIDTVTFQRRTIGHSYHLPKFTSDQEALGKLLYKLCEKMGRRLRGHNLGAQGIHVSFVYNDGTYWHHSHKMATRLYTGKQLFDAAFAILTSQPEPKLVRILAVNCFALFDWQPEQLNLFPIHNKNVTVANALDIINNRWGEWTIMPARLMDMDNIILDRISFGKVA